jgi:4-amino-4-deoxy-L-arabinose transferase-like glycosyltransferase
VALATVRIAATYGVFSHTFDEPAHVATGMEWLERGAYRLEPQHPPLARVLVALGPYLAGERGHGHTDIYNEGALILYNGGRYRRNLTLARLGTLPFFWLACAVVWMAGARWYGRGEAACAVLLFTLLPPVLAHASLATTDMALTATFGLALYALLRWWQTPKLAHGAAMGAAVAVAVLAKFSSLAFLPACALALAALFGRPWRGARAHLVSGLAGLAVALVVIWAGYRFSWEGKLPAPELFAGIAQLRQHQQEGNWSYLLGATSRSGFAWYYPVALALKTPLGFLILAMAGVGLATVERRKAVWLAPAALSAAILTVGLYSRINIGVRHILPVYGFLALLAGACAWRGWSAGQPWLRRAAWACVAWMALSGAAHHPDYLAYFNELAGAEPERYLVDSDLDWGQDLLRLEKRVKELKLPALTFTPFTVADLEGYHGFPPVSPNLPHTPSPGWNAVSITYWKSGRMGWFDRNPGARPWPDYVKPTERVGGGILLYYLPPEQFRPAR